MPKQTSKFIFFSGGILTIIGSVAQVFDFKSAPWIFSVGSALLIYVNFMNYWYKKEDELIQSRLARIGFISSLLLVLSAYFMFTGSNLWVLAVLIYALSSLYVSFRSE